MESIFLFGSPNPIFLSGKTGEGLGNAGVLLDETTVEVGEAKEGLEFSLARRCWPSCNTFNFNRIHLHISSTNDYPKILNLCSFKRTLLMLEIEFVLSKDLKNLLNNDAMFFDGLGR